jgi:stage II sporulation protein E
MGTQKLTFFPAAKELIFSGRYCSDMNDADMAGESRCSVYERIDRLADTFSSLSEIFYNLSDRLGRPPVPELRRMCDRVYDKYCPLCPSREICWELEYNSSKDMLSRLSERLGEKGLADKNDLPDYMRSRCVALPGIIGEINTECAELYKSFKLSDKTMTLAMEYRCVSSLLSDICEENKKDYAPDKQLSSRLSDVLAEYGFGEDGVSVYGDRRKKIVARGFDVSRGRIGNSDLKRVVEKACGFPVSEPVIELDENIMTLRMTARRRFSAESIIQTRGAENDVCGDSVATFENCDDRYFALISDGMGTGEEASMTSSICSIFLQKMISAGNGEYVSVKMLNSFIRSKTGECSSTADLMGLDLLTGRISFTKCGAALSLVKRGKDIFKLSATAPNNGNVNIVNILYDICSVIIN